ncbi:hypothetical protein, partial [Flavobacterium branchiarum]
FARLKRKARKVLNLFNLLNLWLKKNYRKGFTAKFARFTQGSQSLNLFNLLNLWLKKLTAKFVRF